MGHRRFSRPGHLGTTASRHEIGQQAVEQPKERTPGLQQGQLLRKEVDVYGTVRYSAKWRETIRQYILELGYVQTRADA